MLKIADLSVEAGRKVLEIYDSDDFGVERKKDDSPLTRADRASNEIIVRGLADAYPGIPILSEEARQIPYGVRNGWDVFWLVDPLDGTKEFISGNGEFTVNIALIREGMPVMGVIYAPVPRRLYFTEGGSAFAGETVRGAGDAGRGARRIRAGRGGEGDRVAVRSRSHASGEEAALFERLGVTRTISAGSSLKFCMVAEGKAHLYYRHGPTMEWDTAAGHAIAEAAGARVQGLRYNKPNLKNGPFRVSAAGIPDETIPAERGEEESV